MEKYIVQFFGFNDDIEQRELLGSAFLVKPHYLITAAHVILDKTGSLYKNRGFLYKATFHRLPEPTHVEHKEEYSINDDTCLDLVIFKIDLEVPDAFQLSTREVGYKESFSFFGKSGIDEGGVSIRSRFEVTISFHEHALKIFDRGRIIFLQNCIMLKEILSPGDSGAPIFINEEVVGMVIYGIKDWEKKSTTSDMYGTVAVKSSYINGILEELDFQ